MLSQFISISDRLSQNLTAFNISKGNGHQQAKVLYRGCWKVILGFLEGGQWADKLEYASPWMEAAAHTLPATLHNHWI